MSNNRYNRKIDPENFEEAFLEENPTSIYDQCIADFKLIIVLDLLEKMVHGYNQEDRAVSWSPSPPRGAPASFVARSD
ncbi:hypothetical protein GCM10022378_08340 [Salinicoccus jeotgali]|uniref:Uncharacterized protein n=1 Tax=Salinicoccus jeotgali TaxID=381634 RepID=A0ABP7EMZ7_9STAP